jgi:hypothetical protein
MNTYTPADTLHRLVKQALDSGAASSIAEAEAIFGDYRVEVRIDPELAGDAHHQAALITAVALARRVFLGGVTVSALPHVPLLCPLPLGPTLADAVRAAGAVIGFGGGNLPLIEIGGRPCERRQVFHVRVLFAGWRGGIVPANSDVTPVAAPTMPLAPMLAAAFAINEAFLFVSGHAAFAGRRSAGLSLWNPASQSGWLSEAVGEPEVQFLPSRLWLIGLGHLGQAYLWALGLLPYAKPQEVSLFLQDIDVITPSTESTSVLSDSTLLGEQKTRAMAAWAKRRGFFSAIQERLFDARMTRRPDEPAIALCGLDNSLGRHALDRVGFDFIVEAGLGRGHRDFRSLRLHTLPASRTAAHIWRAGADEQSVSDRPAYKKMLKSGVLDKCGVTLLAGKAVGAPFVGAVAACLVVSELLRLLHGGTVFELIDLDLKAPEHRLAVPTSRDFSTLNPGYAVAAPRTSSP